MKAKEVIHAWGGILAGRKPALSIEITRECPLRCPGCYAYDAAHLGGGLTLRDLADEKGDDLVRGILKVIDERRPLHVSLVGGDPLVRYRELEVLIPQIIERGVHVQVVTSAFRQLPESWKNMHMLNPVISIDGLQPEHDIRRKPATYDRILKNIEGVQITVHCTVTSQMTAMPGYMRRFVEFWSANHNVKRIWISLFTPQIGATDVEILSPAQRRSILAELSTLAQEFKKLDLNPAMAREYLDPPSSPADCIFARTTETISADLKTKITPCQFGGNPDCSQCGCIASMGLAALGHYKVLPFITAGNLFSVSELVGSLVGRVRDKEAQAA